MTFTFDVKKTDLYSTEQELAKDAVYMKRKLRLASVNVDNNASLLDLAVDFVRVYSEDELPVKVKDALNRKRKFDEYAAMTASRPVAAQLYNGRDVFCYCQTTEYSEDVYGGFRKEKRTWTVASFWVEEPKTHLGWMNYEMKLFNWIAGIKIKEQKTPQCAK